MNRFVRFLILLVLVSLSCNSATDLFSSGGEVHGPIRAVATAAALDEQGELVGESYSFAPTAAQVTVVIYVGKLADSSALIVTWYRVSDQGDEQLFEHSIQVEALDRAYSIGANPGVLALGTYRAVAALGDATQTITWVVAEAQTEAEAESLENAAALQTEQGQAPTSGGSGKVSASQRAAGQPAAAGKCNFDADLWFNHYQPFVLFWGSAIESDDKNPSLCAGLGDLEVLAAIGDNEYVSVCTITIPEGGRNSLLQTCEGKKDPCFMPGRTDLPETVVKARLRQMSTGKILAENKLTLSPDNALPTVQLVAELSQPLHDGKVKAGDKIKLIAIAKDSKIADGWQTGISEVWVVSNQGEPKPVYEQNLGNESKSCSDLRMTRKTEPIIFEVPKGVKGELIFCAQAKDFHGFRAEEDCKTFQTGKKVAGKLTSTTTSLTSASDGGTTFDKSDIDLSVTLQDDGSLSGTAQIAYSYHGEGTKESCGPWTHTVDPLKFTFPVSGDWTEQAIDFRFIIDAPIMTTSTFTGCGKSERSPFEVRAATFGGNSVTVGASTNSQDWHANWDGQAYTADDTFSTPDIEWHWTIHLEPPALPSVLNPGLSEALPGDHSPID